jgi:hypothetical protein
MSSVTNYPLLVFLLSFVAMWLATVGGAFLIGRRALEPDAREDFGIILAATLTLLALIIGFSFSMALSRYDLRKSHEANEANAIGTAYARADLLPAADAARVRAQLLQYVDQRILFYSAADEAQLAQIAAVRARLQAELWSAVLAPAEARPTPVVALAVEGMNDVLNSQAFAQAAWWNRIPGAAWVLMVAMGICCCVLAGYRVRSPKALGVRLVVLPFVFSVALFFIADIDAPRGGLIRVQPQNLESLAEGLRAAGGKP